MKTLRLFFTFLFISSFTIAQEYQSIAITSGFNADVIANGIGASNSTTDDLDGAGYALVSKGFQPTVFDTSITYGLPTSGFLNSASTSGLSYQLAYYSSNNSLRLSMMNISGTLIFTTPTKAKTLYVLATSGGSYSSRANIVVNFSDGSNQTFSSVIVDDWYDNNSYFNTVAVKGTGRVYRSTNALEYDSRVETPRLYQIPLVINDNNQSKDIQSITIQTSSISNVINVFAVSALVKPDIVPDANGRVYVNTNVTVGTESGNSWLNATKNLKDAINEANTNNDIKEIWVAKGTYYPSVNNNRDDFFYITRNNLKVYGGFVGTETNLSQRNISENVTILSGDIGTLGSAADNSYHIMVIDAISAAIDNSTQIDGFTFQDGNSSLGSVYNNYFPRFTGSAILIYPSDLNNSPTISNNIFKNNSHFQIGALEIEGNTFGTNVTKVQNCYFGNNYAKYAGGGIGIFNNINGNQNVEITDCIFEGNIVDNASQGGAPGGVGAAIFAYGTNKILVNRSKFINNLIGSSTQYAGTYKGTAIAARDGSEVTIVNSLAYSDQIYIPFFNSSSSFTFINSTVYNPDGGTLLSTVSPVLNSVQNSIFWMGGNSVNTIDGTGTTLIANNSIILPKYNVTLSGSNNYTTDPLFNNITANDFTLKSSSNGINKGNNSFYDVSKYGNYDFLNNSRIEESIIDIGAFELQPTLSVSDINKTKNIVIYPNPVKEILSIVSNEKILKTQVISMDGKIVTDKNANNERILDVKHLQKGIYLIKIFTETRIQTEKFIKE